MFKLNLESSRDITSLSINFSDGSSVVSVSPKTDKCAQQTENLERTSHKREQYMDLNAEFGNIPNDVVTLPEIQRSDKPINVADELQNLDI